MNKFFKIILTTISLFFYGCTPPPISVLYLTDSRYSGPIIHIENSTYFLENQYDINTFSYRIRDTLITYCKIQDIHDNDYTFDKLKLSDSTLICYDDNSADSLKLTDIKMVQLFRASTSEEKAEGWTQVICWSLLGLLSDLSNKKDGEDLQLKGTATGGLVGLSLGSLFFFDDNKAYEDIYFKHN